jgi:hypothetical protein
MWFNAITIKSGLTFNTHFIILVFILLFGSYHQPVAQTITLGTGTNVTTTTTASPINIYYRRFVAQFVYTAAEINAAGGAAGLINQLGFYVQQAPIYAIPGYTIKIKHVTANNVAAALGTTGWTTVKNAFNYTPIAGGYNMIAFDTPFNWNGTSNLGIEICCSQVTPNWNASGTCRFYNATNGYRYTWTDAAGNSCGSAPGTTSTFKPQCQLVMSDETIWTGAINTNWFTAGNWTRGVPNSLMNATIPTGLTNYPTINAANATCKNISIANGAQLTILSTNSLRVFGNWLNNGLFNANSSTVELAKSSLTTVNGVNNQSFFNLKIAGSGGASFNTGSFQIRGSLYAHGGTITTNNRITLTSTSSGTGRIPEIKTNCNYTLTMNDSFGDGWNGGFLTVLVNGVSAGVYSAAGSGSTATFSVLSGSTITLNYTSGSWENENSFTLANASGSIVFSATPNIPTGNIFTTTSNCSIPNPFVGNIRIQRYLSLSNDGWREMSAPVTGQTLANWQDDGLVMTNFPGSSFPNFGWTSVYAYDENNANGNKDNGWIVPTSISDPLTPFSAHKLYIGQGNFTVSVEGPIYAGTVTFNPKFQNILPAEIAANMNQKGWNLIGNPFPCTLSWDNIPLSNKINVDNAIWIWAGETGNYGLYVGGAGVGTNGVSNQIASCQGFWIHANATGAQLIVNENNKLDSDATFVKNTSPNEFFTLQLQTPSNLLSDEVALTIHPDYNDSIDDNDGLKLFSPLPQAPSLYFLIDSSKVSLNAHNLLNETHIPIVAKVATSQSINLKVSQFNANPNRCLLLEDLVTQTNYVIDSTFSESIYLQANDTTPRFILHSYPLLQSSIIPPSCADSEDGIISIDYGRVPATYSVFDELGLLLSQQFVDTLPYNFPNLGNGTYTVSSNPPVGCPLNEQEWVFNTEPPLLNFTIIDASCTNCNDGSITWNFLQGNQPILVYHNSNLVEELGYLASGSYEFSVVDANGCERTETIEVNVNIALGMTQLKNSFKIFPNPAEDWLYVESHESIKSSTIELIDMLGKRVKIFEFEDSKSSVYIGDIATGTYFIRIENEIVGKIIKK